MTIKWLLFQYAYNVFVLFALYVFIALQTLQIKFENTYQN